MVPTPHSSSPFSAERGCRAFLDQIAGAIDVGIPAGWSRRSQELQFPLYDNERGEPIFVTYGRSPEEGRNHVTVIAALDVGSIPAELAAGLGGAVAAEIVNRIVQAAEGFAVEARWAQTIRREHSMIIAASITEVIHARSRMGGLCPPTTLAEENPGLVEMRFLPQAPKKTVVRLACVLPPGTPPAYAEFAALRAMLGAADRFEAEVLSARARAEAETEGTEQSLTGSRSIPSLAPNWWTGG